jgi:hypothetical protein
MSRRPITRCLTPTEWKARIRAAHGSLYLYVAGTPRGVRLEEHPNHLHVDHVWIDLAVPPCGMVRLSLNTLSKLNERAGFDPRVRLAISRTVYHHLPEPMLEESAPLDYRLLDEGLSYALYEQDALRTLLVDAAKRAVRIEAWGELYTRDHIGLHQLHSRRASCAVARDYLGKDGAIKLYYQDRTAELLLVKFCGQA